MVKNLFKENGGHSNRVVSLASDSNGEILCSGGVYPESAVKVWEISTGIFLTLITLKFSNTAHQPFVKKI
jgi:hypothetical protein